MTKIFAAGIAAVLLGGAAILFSGFSTSEAHSIEALSSHALSSNAVAKSDRLDAKPFGPACSQASWPYYEASCLRHTAKPTREALPVRVVTTERAR
jgi:hypothetical protein